MRKQVETFFELLAQEAAEMTAGWSSNSLTMRLHL
jgi:hypothetical protein